MDQLPALASGLGSKPLLIMKPGMPEGEELMAGLQRSRIPFETIFHRGEPRIEDLEKSVIPARLKNCDLIIGFGGGSVIDLAKATAALSTNSGDILDYMEVIGSGKPMTVDPLPCIVIPTTAGTGAEVTRNAVIGSRKHGVKVSIRHPLMLPDIALVDPSLTLSMPPGVTASTGLDALTQLIEAYLSCHSNPLTDALCLKGIECAISHLQRAYGNPRDLHARENMSLASLFGGLALANAGLGAVHGFAGPLGGMFPISHGLVCASLLPHVMKVNLKALERDRSDSYLSKFDRLAGILVDDDDATAIEGVKRLRQLCLDLNIPGLQELGMEERYFPEIIEKSRKSSSMKGNPVELTEKELREILEAAY